MFYAVKKGRINGIYTKWEDCKNQTNMFKGAKFKKFSTKIEALNYMNEYIEKPISNNIDYVYCDGSCINNGKKYAKAGIGIYFGVNDKRNLSKKVIGNTNNIAELQAMIETYYIIKNDILNKKIVIVSDSEYTLNCVKKYGKKQELNNWNIDIPNKQLVRTLYELYKNTDIGFMHIYSHTNKKDIHSIGNSEADKLAYKAVI